MERRELVHHALVLLDLIGVNGLRVLAKVVKAGELLATVAGERPLAGMLPTGESVISMRVRGVDTEENG
jgi:hypothetical protein